MNKIIIVFVLFSMSLFGQEKAFTIDNKQVVWERIYNTDKTIKEIKDILKSSGKIKITDEEEKQFSGEISDFIMDFKGAGYTLMGTPNYLTPGSKFSGNFKIQIKEGRYRATVTNIRMKGASFSIYSGGIGVSDDGDDNLEFFALTNDREYFRAKFDGKESRIINYSFAHLFDVTKYKKDDNDW